MDGSSCSFEQTNMVFLHCRETCERLPNMF